MKNFQVKSILFSLFVVLMVSVLLTSCEREPFIGEETGGFKTQPLVTETSESTNLASHEKGMPCDCSFITGTVPSDNPNINQYFPNWVGNQYADVNDDGNISVADVYVLTQIINNYGDGVSVQPFYFNQTPWVDYNRDGIINKDDTFAAFFIAAILKQIAPDNDTLDEADKQCIRNWIFGLLDCEEEDCTIALGCQGQVKNSGTGWENLTDCTFEAETGFTWLRPTVPGPYGTYTYEWSASDGGWGHAPLKRPHRYTARAAGTYTVRVCENEATGGDPDCCEEITFTII